MTVLAMLHPTTLVGREIRETLENHRSLWSQLNLFSTNEAEVGTLVDVRGAAAMVQELRGDSLEGADVVLLCGPWAACAPALEQLPPAATALVLSPDAGVAAGNPIVAGINLEDAQRGERMLSPHPAAVALGLILKPLAGLGLSAVTATVIQPASMRDQEGLDELFEQTRRVLAFAGEQPREVFGRQLAFNLFPPEDAAPPVAELVTALVDSAPKLSVEILQGGFFHGCALSLALGFTEDPGTEAIRDALSDAPHLEWAGDDELSPVDAAAREDVLIGRLRRDAGGYRLWSVSDNLTRGSALNAVEILRHLFDQG
ncbi:MAG: Asd/ArgC dimerization domain-containing protein [Acidobacteriota bacterium]|nr:Asd/ArgC dimerization domain-containing protein [Acidobacteriota bacterium]